MRVYEGVRTEDGCRVTVDGRNLELRHDLRNHSPTGAEWGYGGSGPAQLALGLLADALGEELALRHYQLFKREIVAGFEQQGWILTQAEIRCWIAKVLSSQEGM